MKKKTRHSRFKKGSPTAREEALPETEAEARDLWGDHEFEKRLRETKARTQLSQVQKLAASCHQLLDLQQLPPFNQEKILVRSPVKRASDLEWRSFDHEEASAAKVWPPGGWTEIKPRTLPLGDGKLPNFIPHDSLGGYAYRILSAIEIASWASERASVAAENGRGASCSELLRLAMDMALEAGHLYGEAKFAEWFSASHRQDPNAAYREEAIATAQRLWREDPTLRMGEVVARIASSNSPVEEKQIREWLKSASRTGVLKIPANAQRRGRPRQL